MSSERNYKKDTEWSWLRNDSPVGRELLHFQEMADSNLYELVVDKNWPTRVISLLSTILELDTHALV